MNRTIVNTLLLAATVGLVSLNWLLAPSPTTRNFEILPDMVTSPAYGSYSTNPHFADGKTLREPVPGTVVRGLMPLHYAATKEDAERAGRELASPFAGEKAVLDRGAVVYDRYCGICHGPQGKGDGTVAKRGFPAPPSLLDPRALALPDGQMFHVLTYGQANMPSYAAQISREDRWRVIEYVRTLQGAGR